VGTDGSEQTRLKRLAEVAVKVGANVQPGRLAVVLAIVEAAPAARAVARAAYRAGARHVDIAYVDVDGFEQGGSWVPIIRDNAFQIA
jgi:leucyl aminopeptidase (aminopeptidase T)